MKAKNVLNFQIRVFFCLCYFGLSFWTPTALGNISEDINHLWKQAESKQLNRHSYWLRLLHFPTEVPFVGEWRSEIETPEFFLHPDGATNPAAELRKTLQTLFSPTKNFPDAHTQCRFIARFHWLKTQLDFSKTSLPRVRCKRFEQWVNMGVTLPPSGETSGVLSFKTIQNK